MNQYVPYAVTAVGLLAGLAIFLAEPLPSPTLNYVVGGGLLAVAVVAVTMMIAEGSEPGERGPDF